MPRITVELSDSQLGQLDRLRGKLARHRQLEALIADGLNRVSPSDEMKPEDVLKLVPVTSGGKLMLEENPNPPTVAELAPYVPFPFPPPPGHGIGEFQEHRFSAWRAAWACYMENAGWSWDAIASQLGYASARTAQQAATRHTVQYMEKAASERRQEMRVRVGRLRDWAWEHIETPPYKFTVTGNLIVNPDGTPALDEDIRIRYLDVALKIEERQAKMDGSDPRDAQKIEAGNLDYMARINELIGQVRAELTAKRDVIAGEIEPPQPPSEPGSE